MSFGSMQYTIGTAIDRALQDGYRVALLVEGHWVEGVAVAADGVGVVLESAEQQHAVVRLDRISAVRVESAAPMRRPVPAHATAGPGVEERSPDGAVPMPGPRQPED